MSPLITLILVPLIITITLPPLPPPPPPPRSSLKRLEHRRPKRDSRLTPYGYFDNKINLPRFAFVFTVVISLLRPIRGFLGELYHFGFPLLRRSAYRKEISPLGFWRAIIRYACENNSSLGINNFIPVRHFYEFAKYVISVLFAFWNITRPLKLLFKRYFGRIIHLTPRVRGCLLQNSEKSVAPKSCRPVLDEMEPYSRSVSNLCLLIALVFKNINCLLISFSDLRFQWCSCRLE